MPDIKLKRYKKFYCRKHDLFGKCNNCQLLNGGCDYHRVFEHEDKPDFNPCPICEYKETERCNNCNEVLSAIARLNSQLESSKDSIPIWVVNFTEALLRKAFVSDNPYYRRLLDESVFSSYKMVLENMESITDLQLETLIMRYSEPFLKNAEIAKRFGVSASNVGQNLRICEKKVLAAFRKD